MRHAFNLREGIKPEDSVLPPRSVGEPPLTEGPLAGKTIEHKKLIEQFCESIQWDKKTHIPTRESLEALGGMDDVIKDLHG